MALTLMHFPPTVPPPSQFSLLRRETENRKKKKKKKKKKPLSYVCFNTHPKHNKEEELLEGNALVLVP